MSDTYPCDNKTVIIHPQLVGLRWRNSSIDPENKEDRREDAEDHEGRDCSDHQGLQAIFHLFLMILTGRKGRGQR